MIDQQWLADRQLAAPPGVFVEGERCTWTGETAVTLGRLLGQLHSLHPWKVYSRSLFRPATCDFAYRCGQAGFCKPIILVGARAFTAVPLLSLEGKRPFSLPSCHLSFMLQARPLITIASK